jgi:hypothetical protein
MCDKQKVKDILDRECQENHRYAHCPEENHGNSIPLPCWHCDRNSKATAEILDAVAERVNA